MPAAANHQCACPGRVLTFNCTTVGLGTTLWTGSAFKCPNSANQIVLRNSKFSSASIESFGACNSGDIIAKGVNVDGNRHTSQLNVTVSAGLNQSYVECKYNSAEGLQTIGVVMLTVLLSEESV